MITFAISLKVDGRTRGDVIEVDELDPESLARIEESMHEMRDELERVARRRAAKRAREGES